MGHCVKFQDFLSTHQEAPSSTIVHHMIALYDTMKSQCATPRKFLSMLQQKFKKTIYIFEQNDINEFLMLFIDKINSEIIIPPPRLTSPSTHKQIQSSMTQLRRKMQEHWINSNKKDYSTLKPLFFGQQISQITCSHCNKLHHTYELIMNMPLPIPQSASSLSDCFDEYFKDENVTDWTCDGCKNQNPSEKVVKLWRNPNILILSLKRFGSDLRKRETHIDVPFEIDLSKYTISNTNKHYQLKSIAFHAGGVQSGHYFAICRRDNVVKHETKKETIVTSWHKYDDEDVREVSQSDLVKIKNYGYVFFYEAVSGLSS
jgi:ubiquitin C-terminal hydrolase